MKTRLEPAVGPEGAALLYRAFLEDLSGRLAGAGRWESFAVHDGRAPGEALGALFGSGWAFAPQGEGGLGTRLAHVFRRLAGSGEGATLIAGSDVPALSAGAVEGAFDALERSGEAVFAPSPDGGFSLVGLPWGRTADFLEGPIAWSTEEALAGAIDGARAVGHGVRILEPVPDVDVPADLVGLRRLLREEPDAAPATARALLALDGAGFGAGVPR